MTSLPIRASSGEGPLFEQLFAASHAFFFPLFDKDFEPTLRDWLLTSLRHWHSNTTSTRLFSFCATSGICLTIEWRVEQGPRHRFTAVTNRIVLKALHSPLSQLNHCSLYFYHLHFLGKSAQALSALISSRLWNVQSKEHRVLGIKTSRGRIPGHWDRAKIPPVYGCKCLGLGTRTCCTL